MFSIRYIKETVPTHWWPCFFKDIMNLDSWNKIWQVVSEEKIFKVFNINV